MAEGTAKERVDALPRRVAHVVFAILTLAEETGGPHRATEIVVYDKEARSRESTGRALASALKLGLVERLGEGLWTPTPDAWMLREALEVRFYADLAASEEEEAKAASGERKRCNACHRQKPLDQFSKDRSRADGRCGRCKLCTRAAVRASEQRNPVRTPRKSMPVVASSAPFGQGRSRSRRSARTVANRLLALRATTTTTRSRLRSRGSARVAIACAMELRSRYERQS